MHYGQHAILKNLDNPTRILTLRLQDLIAYITPVIIASLVDSMLIVSSLGVCIVFFIQKLLRRLPRFYFIRLLYRYLPTRAYNKKMKTKLLPSHVRFWLRR